MKFVLISLFVLSSGVAFAQSDTVAAGKKAEPVSYVPKLDGTIKAKMEVDLNGGEYRFSVRNARLGVRGDVSPKMNYRLQMDFGNEGKISLLDAYAGYQSGGFTAELGQQQYHFSTDMDRGPSTNLFANRSFLSKYLTSYYGSELSGGKTVDYVRTLGSRDLGAFFSYRFASKLPLKLLAGVFNGSGINNPVWGKHVNVIGRAELGGSEGLQGAVAYYDGYAPQHTRVVERDGENVTENFEQKMRMAGFELRYVRGKFRIEGEYARRYLGTGSSSEVMAVALVQGFYRFDLPERSFARYLLPVVRWDLGNGVDYLNSDTRRRELFDANRITAGINLGFSTKLVRSEVRLNYEKYLLKERPSDFAVNKLLHDKFTLEIVASF